MDLTLQKNELSKIRILKPDDIKKSKITISNRIKIKKSNALTDAKITDFSLSALKMINVLYYTWQEAESNKFVVPLADLAKLLDIRKKSNRYGELIISRLEELYTPIKLRNFKYKGRDIKYKSASFISSLTIYKKYENYIEIAVNDEFIDILTQSRGYTPIELRYSNSFKSKYGLKLWEMFRRYKTQAIVGKEKDDALNFTKKTLENLNDYFMTNFKSPSMLLSNESAKTKRPINRALEEIKNITGEEIYCFYMKEDRVFVFSWEKPEKSDFIEFKRYIRTQYTNATLLVDDINDLELAVSLKGKLYNKRNGKSLKYKSALTMWEFLFEKRESVFRRLNLG